VSSIPQQMIFPLVCIITVSVDEWNTANSTIVSVFISKLQVPEILAFFLVDSVVLFKNV
jgi:hypothetical protein